MPFLARLMRLILTVVLLLSGMVPGHAQTPAADGEVAAADWSGDWQSYWRGGLAELSLRQEGDRVTGSYLPDDGVIEGKVTGRLLEGTWREPGSSGGFIFALGDDGQSFTGRFSSGEYWNGQRIDDRATDGDAPGGASPRDTLDAVLQGSNAAIFQNDSSALRRIADLMVFEGDEKQLTDHSRRRYLLWEISDMSTLRLGDAPDGPDEPGGTLATFPIGPLVGGGSYTLRFRLDPDGVWRLLVAPLDELQAAHDALLQSLGFRRYADFAEANAASPRNTFRKFVEGTTTWEEGGREAVMATLDLSEIPPRLRPLEAEIASDYLREIVNRVGYGPWQEIPNLTDQAEPYLFYVHPAGTIAIARQGGGSEPVRWVFPPETLRAAPAVYRAIQALPLAAGVGAQEPLSPFFQVREMLSETDPRLLRREFGLETWQWLGIVATLTLSAAAGLAAALLLPPLIRGAIRLTGYRGPIDHLEWVRRTAAASAFVLVLLGAYETLGLTSNGAGVGGRAMGVAAVLSVAGLALSLVALLGRLFQSVAASARGYVDEIVTSLAIGLLKVIIVVMAIMLAADVIGLPYEGVLTGLGIGGVALAFAARETVSNLLGGAILLADRPFKRGDMIEVEQRMAVIESVGLRSTRLRTPDDTLLVVPNSRLSDQPIANWGSRRRRRVHLLMAVTYDTPPDRLQAFRDGLVEVYLAQPLTDPDEISVGVRGFRESAIEIEMIGYLKVYANETQVEAQHALILEIIRLAERLGVAFAAPTRPVRSALPGDEGTGAKKPEAAARA